MADTPSKSERKKLRASHKANNAQKGRKGLKTYLKTLLTLNTEASEDSERYATAAPLLKTAIASFKSLFGKYTLTKYCNDATYVCFKLLKTVRQYDDKYVYEFYTNWSQMMRSFDSESRSEAFIKNFGKFETIVEQLQSAENRWTQLMILSLIRLYAKNVATQTMQGLASGSEFMKVIQKMVRLPHGQETTLKANNALITSINSENGWIQSFQPKKIYCDGEEYTSADFDLWMDWHVTKKVVSFVVMSLAADKNQNICGQTVYKRMRISSRQNDLFVRNYWDLGSTQGNPQTRRIDIQFCLSARTHSLIIESDLRNIFKITVDKRTEHDDKGMAVHEFVEPKAKLTDGHNQSPSFPNVEADFDVREKPTKEHPDKRSHPAESTQPAKNQEQATIKRTMVSSAENQQIRDMPITSTSHSPDVGTTTVRTSDYFAESSSIHNKSDGNRQHKKIWPKRRSDQVDVDTPLDVTCRKKRQRRAEPDTLKNGIQGERELNKHLPNEANDIGIEETIRRIRLQRSRSQSSCSVVRPQKFSYTVWCRSWSIRRYFRDEVTTLEPHHVDEMDVEETVQIKDDDVDHYESVSNPLRCSIDV